jgi:hypothetical protein
MQKFSTNVFDDAPPRRRSQTPAVITIALGLLLSPLVFEATQLCAANWKGMNGNVPFVSTPVLNVVGSGLQSAGDEFRSTLSPVLHRLPWDSSYVVVFGLGWASIAAFLLRR